jgi:predicted Zn-dependent peptidase
MKVSTFFVKGVKVALIHHKSPISFAGVTVKNGSNYEKPSQEGLSHFCEHMFFKGTKSRTYEKLNKEFALIGASQNAYTSNSFVLYHMTVPYKNINKAFNLLNDMFFNSVFDNAEIEKEKDVINEEIKMYQDNPQYWFYDKVGEKILTRPIGHPVIGNEGIVNAVTSTKIKNYLNGSINRNNFMFIIVGNHTEKQIAKILEDNIPNDHSYLKDGVISFYKGALWKKGLNFDERIVIENKNAQQSIAEIIFPYISKGDENYYASKILGNALGGGMYSYLFNQIREKMGLAYSTGFYSSEMEYGKLALCSVYAYLDKKNIDKFYKEARKILNNVNKNGLDEDIFQCAKMQLLSSKSKKIETSSGLSSYYKSIFNGENIKDEIQQIEKVEINDCNNILNSLLYSRNVEICMKSTK